METFDNLTLIKLLSTAVAVAMAFMAYLHLRNARQKKMSQKNILWRTTLLLALPIILLVLIFNSNANNFNALEVSFNEKNIPLYNAHHPIKEINSDQYFHNSDIGFVLQKPSKKWSRIKRGSGLIDFLKMSGLKKEEITPAKLAEYNNDPFLRIFNYVTFFSFNQSDAAIDLKFTDSTKVGYLKPYEKSYYDQTLDALNKEYSNNLQQNILWADSLTQIAMQSTLSTLDIDFTAQFRLIAFPKDAFDSGLKGLSLAGFYNVYASSFGMNISKLVANQTAILMGVNSLLENVLINTQARDIEINRFTYFAESADYFFILEISHSPQASTNSKQWDELSDVMQSFRIL